MSALTLVTGATGFIGRRVVEQLLRDERAVRLFVRHPGSLPPTVLARVQVVQGDIRDGAALERAVRGCSTVLHLAACARAWCRHAEEFEQVNLQAVEQLVAAAGCERVQRLVHVSTVLTLLRPPAARQLTLYERSKLAGERLVESCGNATILHPTRVYGPGPLNDANGTTKVIAAYLAGSFRFRLHDHDVLANYVHVDDVAEGIVLAAAAATPAGHYALGGENVSLRELLERVARLSGVRHGVLRIRPGLALAGAAVAEAWGRFGGNVPIARDWVRLFLEDQRLPEYPTPPGYRPRPLDAGLAETIAWLRAERRAA